MVLSERARRREESERTLIVQRIATRRTKADLVPSVELNPHSLADSPVVDERAIGRCIDENDDALFLPNDLRMVTRNLFVVDDKVAGVLAFAVPTDNVLVLMSVECQR